MDPLDYVIQNGSYLLLLGGLVAAGLGVPVTEDVYILAAGVLAQRGIVEPVLVMPVLFAGVIIGDVLIFTIARRLGPAVYRRRLFAFLMPPGRRSRMEGVIGRRGGAIVFGARFVAGLRMPVFALCATHDMKLSRFLLWDIAAMILSIPIVFGLGWWFSSGITEAAEGLSSVRSIVLMAVAGVLAVGGAIYLASRRRGSTTEADDTPPGSG